MPELPEVEVVRRGLQRWVTGRRIADVVVAHGLTPVVYTEPGIDALAKAVADSGRAAPLEHDFVAGF